MNIAKLCNVGPSAIALQIVTVPIDFTYSVVAEKGVVRVLVRVD